MLSRFLPHSRSLLRTSLPMFQSRNFLFFSRSKEKNLPSNEELEAGKSLAEYQAELKGWSVTRNHPIVPDEDAGTRENPIQVPSHYALRTVGFEDPHTAQMWWFNLREGKLCYVEELGLYFNLQRVPDVDLDTLDVGKMN